MEKRETRAAGWLEALARMNSVVAGVLFAGLTAVVALQVLTRFVLHVPFSGAPGWAGTAPRSGGEDRAVLFLVGDDGPAVSLVGDFMAHGYPPSRRTG